MITTKQYRLNRYSNCVIPFKIDGKEIFVEFVGHFGNRGTYSTSNEKIQKALESHKGFNVIYSLALETKTKTAAELLKEEEERIAAEEAAKQEAETNSQEEETATGDAETAVSEDVKEYSVKNIQEANALAKKLFGEDTTTFRSSERAIEFFSQNGYTLTFNKA